ncbi:unnamed protein product [Clavelina lepadiformis]|uniref:Uncharacterized protein n=1 Tax=Clavelina lepadiformis TaxID=159417 RepID=A0ABP0FIM5_CLALP
MSLHSSLPRYLHSLTNVYAGCVRWSASLHGGYDILNIPVYANLFYLKPLTLFCKDKIANKVLSLENRTIEHQIGHQLSNLLGIQIDNRTPHATSPSIYYDSNAHPEKNQKEATNENEVKTQHHCRP